MGRWTERADGAQSAIGRSEPRREAPESEALRPVTRFADTLLLIRRALPVLIPRRARPRRGPGRRAGRRHRLPQRRATRRSKAICGSAPPDRAAEPGRERIPDPRRPRRRPAGPRHRRAATRAPRCLRSRRRLHRGPPRRRPRGLRRRQHHSSAHAARPGGRLAARPRGSRPRARRPARADPPRPGSAGDQPGRPRGAGARSLRAPAPPWHLPGRPRRRADPAGVDRAPLRLSRRPPARGRLAVVPPEEVPRAQACSCARRRPWRRLQGSPRRPALAVQVRLSLAGFGGEPDGAWGPVTEGALRRGGGRGGWRWAGLPPLLRGGRGEFLTYVESPDFEADMLAARVDSPPISLSCATISATPRPWRSSRTGTVVRRASASRPAP